MDGSDFHCNCSTSTATATRIHTMTKVSLDQGGLFDPWLRVTAVAAGCVSQNRFDCYSAREQCA